MAAAKKTTKPAVKKPAHAKPRTSPGVFDISKPGAPSLGATAAPNSRAIIIKHQTVQDPMVNAAPKAEERETAPLLQSPAAKKIVIQPLHDMAPEPEAKPEPAVVEPTLAVAETEVKVVVKPQAPVDEPKPAPVTAPVEAPNPVVQTKPEPKVEAQPDAPVIDDEKQDTDRNITIAKLVQDETYFLPIETIEQRRSKRTAIFGVLLIIVLLVAWYNVALDANLLSNTYNLPHTEFFSAKQ